LRPVEEGVLVLKGVVTLLQDSSEEALSGIVPHLTDTVQYLGNAGILKHDQVCFLSILLTMM